MTELEREWFDKAEADYASAELVFHPPSGRPNLDLVCFLSQQCVEKYLKGFLQSQGVKTEKTHDLVALLERAVPYAPLWESWRESFRTLKDYAVEFRYPGDWANPAKAKMTFKLATIFRAEVREVLGLPMSEDSHA